MVSVKVLLLNLPLCLVIELVMVSSTRTWRHGRHVGELNNSEFFFFFENLYLLLCKPRAIICFCFVHQHGRQITWVQAENSLFWSLCDEATLMAISQTDISLFIQLTRRTISLRLQIYFKGTNIFNRQRRFRTSEAKSWTRIDGFSVQFPISTWLTRQAPGESNFLEYSHSDTQQNNWKLTVFKVAFRPKYCRSARLCLDTLFLVELKL